MTPKPLSVDDLDDLARHLDTITTDLLDRLAISACDPWARNGITGPAVQSQPCSRPPYALGADITLSTLREALSSAVTAICEHRGQPAPNVATLVEAAGWVRKHRVALTTMTDGRAHHAALCRIITQAARSSRDDQEYRIPKHRETAMLTEANRIVVDAGRVEKLAAKLGDQARGLNRNRVDYLRRKGHLAGEWDEATHKWWYFLGDVLRAHKRARTAGRAAVSNSDATLGA